MQNNVPKATHELVFWCDVLDVEGMGNGHKPPRGSDNEKRKAAVSATQQFAQPHYRHKPCDGLHTTVDCFEKKMATGVGVPRAQELPCGKHRPDH